MAPFIPASLLHRSHLILQINGANTSVGKTVFSTLLLRSLRRHRPTSPLHYLKPVSTGPSNEADDAHLRRFVPNISSAASLYQYADPISPHLVTPNPPSDTQVLEEVTSHISSHLAREKKKAYLILETAGGVNSPTLSGSSQADLYRPLRLPSLLIGDSRLGGISSTISAWESLHIRGYDVPWVLLFRDEVYQNFGYLTEHFGKHSICTLGVTAPPEKLQNVEDDEAALSEWYTMTSASAEMEELVGKLEEQQAKRLQRLDDMAADAVKNIWYPFTQHSTINKDSITVIDSSHDDFFHSFAQNADDNLIRPTFDASASWWTQGLGHGNPELALAAAHAAGRYGHVIFAGTAHEPAIELSKLLLKTHNHKDGRLEKVFYSDDGSTGCEVAIKMAMRATRSRYYKEAKESNVLEVLGLKGSYHGDTMGCMDSSEPSIYNNEVEWYQGKGYWFDFPTVGMRDGSWDITIPGGEVVHIGGLEEIFDLESRKTSELADRYRDEIIVELKKLKQQGRRFGALLIEPIVLGAGGMIFCDPLFQATLVAVVRNNSYLFNPQNDRTIEFNAYNPKDWCGLPVIYDEVFTGLYRLGAVSPSKLLQQPPDISVHGKLLTGGLVPLAVTLASKKIFDAFLSNEKKDALLHGHSYTAHPVGCEVARYAVAEMVDMDANGAWNTAKEDWGGAKGWSIWHKGFLKKVSRMAQVKSCWALGSVFVVHLIAHDGAGYNSGSAEEFLQRLKENEQWNTHARALGSVVYVIAGLKTKSEVIEGVQDMVVRALAV